MVNWNYDAAKLFVDGISDITTRQLCQLFLSKFVLLSAQKYAVPENAELDLFCVAKIVEKIMCDHQVIKRCLDGENLDAAWEAFADEFEKASEGTAERSI